MTDDPLGGEISISGKITETGVEGKVKSRMVSAFDRLLGNLFDWKNPVLERRASVERAKAAGEIAVIAAIAEAAVKQIGEDPSLARRAVDAHIEQLVRKQHNKEAVVLEAFNEIKALPAQATESSTAESESAELDGDWLNFFESYAEKATTEKMQTLWGRILSGEIRNPGSFSLTTLRVASELEPRIAQMFQRYAATRINEFHLPRPQNMAGTPLRNFLDLEAVGLVQQASGTLHLPRKLETPGQDELMIGREHLLKLLCVEQTSTAYQIPVVGMTMAGSQLAAFLPWDAKLAALAIAEGVKEQFRQITLHKVVASSDGNIHYMTAGEAIFPLSSNNEDTPSAG
ncbi:DUF2806 domain-containing protein [Mesorhizobium sp. M0276]|uniref:DUF2806 domain-containing protein n=1 Tax=Mesorhizobium sp. M0276 TaxID=2956928 RepID=UPI003336B484